MESSSDESKLNSAIGRGKQHDNHLTSYGCRRNLFVRTYRGSMPSCQYRVVTAATSNDDHDISIISQRKREQGDLVLVIDESNDI